MRTQQLNRISLIHRILLPLLLIAFASSNARGQEQTEYGPAKGTLIIIGGGNAEGTGIMERFIQLSGGPNGKFVIVPAAGGNRNADGSIKNYDEQRVIAPWLRRGLKNVRMLHT